MQCKSRNNIIQIASASASEKNSHQKNQNSVWAVENPETYLPDLSGLRSLRIVDLSYNHILSVNPAHLPPNVESLRLTGNNITHLTQWPFLSKLQV
ncbi:hypothetical protein ANCCEY_10274 [Ancylostoma ceylanicum]|uniref:Leucine Rich repeat-containing domain protein n=1 Tax=Ancylostoma ceylanicum TaxID=53326 RepID=A0A0D6LEX7_9BILA|nr:hypothetical protein ANCCEY_10274 [Ancylostoma ceylanicum]